MIQEKSQHNRLYWSCRRGMRELDLMLIPFLNEQYEQLEPQEKERFTDLLECTDADLYCWLTGKALCQEATWSSLINKIRDHAKSTNHLKKIDSAD